jgi:hypothetical protein
MKTVLGLLLMIIFIVCVIALAAAVTWIVVKVSPSGKKKPATDEP